MKYSHHYGERPSLQMEARRQRGQALLLAAKRLGQAIRRMMRRHESLLNPVQSGNEMKVRPGPKPSIG